MRNPIPQPQPVRTDRGAARQQIHPGYIKAAQAKPDTPAEIYAYPTFVRDIGPRQRPLVVPTALPAPTLESSPSMGWLMPTYAVILLTLWAVAANVTPGA